jgi:hypothetical protein
MRIYRSPVGSITEGLETLEDELDTLFPEELDEIIITLVMGDVELSSSKTPPHNAPCSPPHDT